MAKKVIDGYLVKQVIRRNDDERTEDILGVATEEHGAKELIEERTAYYNDCQFEYARSVIENGLAFSRIGDKRGSVIMYTYEKCLIVVGV